MNSCVILKENVNASVSFPAVGKTNYKRELSPSSKNKVNTANKIMSLGNSVVLEETNCEGKVKDIPETGLRNYCLSDLLSDWNSREIEKFPFSWGMNEVPDGLFFAYMGNVSCSVTRSIMIKKDMSC